MSTFAITRVLDQPFDQVLARLPDALQKEGFGVLTRIPLHEKLKEKLGVDLPPYVILGACNPPNAYKALQAEPDIGVMLPCNVVVYERDGRTVVSAIRPSVTLAAVGNPTLAPVAAEIEERLTRVVRSV